MALTASPHTEQAVAPTRGGLRLAAGAAAVLGLALFMTVASVDVPQDPTDRELLAWWQVSGHRTSGVISGGWALIVAISAAVVTNALGALPATGRSRQLTAFVRSMGAAVSAVWLVTGAARAAIGHLVDVMDEPLPGVDVLRVITALNYTLLGLSGMTVLGLLIVATSALVLRTGALARWVGYVGAGCALVILAAVAAQYGAYAMPLAILWAVSLAIALWRQPADPN